MSVTVIGNEIKEPKNLKCPYCGYTEDFHLSWIGNLEQKFGQYEDGERAEYDSHDQEGETTMVEQQISCGKCRQVVLERNVTILVGEWQAPQPTSFLIVVDSEFVRDTQIALVPGTESDNDERWSDTSGQHVMGVFQAMSLDEAIGIAAEKCDVAAEILTGYELG